MGTLVLEKLSKRYGDALAVADVSLNAKQGDLVALLGPSGCGKTTMLNIIGGLDRYTSGNLFINDVSTTAFRDVDWDIYRNTSIGFIFQNYNLIMHQTVLSNVELAMTLAGISREERRRRAVAALEKVGLSDQIKKKPNQLSGGQMQRVAIARSLVNNPDILLADEPTGALDSETSASIMELLREIARDRLVLMVTHNAELAEACSTRIIRLLDGRVISDTNPVEIEAAPAGVKPPRRKKTSMSFLTALTLSLNNLMTKKTRTVLTAFAGSIGIIGIALILSLSSGMNNYIARIQKDTMSTYPIQIQSQTMDFSSMMNTMMDARGDRSLKHERDAVYSNNIVTEMMSTFTAQVTYNDLERFKAYIESDEGKEIRDAADLIEYAYDIDLHVYKSDALDELLPVQPSEMFNNFGANGAGNAFAMNMRGMSVMGGAMSGSAWAELVGSPETLESQYDVVAGRWPEAYDEIAIVVSRRNEISDITLYSLGLMDPNELESIMDALRKGQATPKVETARFAYEDILRQTYKLVPQSSYYTFDEAEGVWLDRSQDDAYLKMLMESALNLRVVGILRPDPESQETFVNANVLYTPELTGYVIERNAESGVVWAQRESPEINVFTGMPFSIGDTLASLTAENLDEFLLTLPEAQQTQAKQAMALLGREQLIKMITQQMAAMTNGASQTTYEDNLELFGWVDYAKPDGIDIYPPDFEGKEKITALIAAYNDARRAEGHEESVIGYTDLIGLMVSSVSSIIDIISYVLIAFVSISLVVSSIMIGIITYISVLERTKEIGILRSIGASKRDISRVFNAETFIVGLVAGGLGIGITMLLNIPINIIIKSLAGVSGISALPLYGGIALVVISVLLTLIAGLIPSRIAAKKDPVEALRTE